MYLYSLQRFFRLGPQQRLVGAPVGHCKRDRYQCNDKRRTATECEKYRPVSGHLQLFGRVTAAFGRRRRGVPGTTGCTGDGDRGRRGVRRRGHNRVPSRGRTARMHHQRVVVAVRFPALHRRPVRLVVLLLLLLLQLLLLMLARGYRVDMIRLQWNTVFACKT